MRIKQKRLRIAGLKDRRAHTYQFVTAYRVTPQQLQKLVHKPWYAANECVPSIRLLNDEISKRKTVDRVAGVKFGITPNYIVEKKNVLANKWQPQIRVGNLKLVKNSQYIGNLCGNQFLLQLRNIKTEEVHKLAGTKNYQNKYDAAECQSQSTSIASAFDAAFVESCLIDWTKRGFINFFGLQRFGINGDVPTHRIGLALLKHDFTGALSLIFEMQKATQMSRFCEFTQKHNSQQKSNNLATRLAAKGLKTESPSIWHSIMQRKDQHCKNCITDDVPNHVSLRIFERHFPRDLLKFYLHSYQSFVWNKTASEIIMNNHQSNRHECILPKALHLPGWYSHEKLDFFVVSTRNRFFCTVLSSRSEESTLSHYLTLYRFLCSCCCAVEKNYEQYLSRRSYFSTGFQIKSD